MEGWVNNPSNQHGSQPCCRVGGKGANMSSMGRKPTVNLTLPPRMRARARGHKVHYYFDTGGKPRKEIPLGSDYTLAVKKWTELQIDQPRPETNLTFRRVSERYI